MIQNNFIKSVGIRYMPGGVASGFNHVDINAPGEKKLYQIKGKKNIRVRQVRIKDLGSSGKDQKLGPSVKDQRARSYR